MMTLTPTTRSGSPVEHGESYWAYLGGKIIPITTNLEDAKPGFVKVKTPDKELEIDATQCRATVFATFGEIKKWHLRGIDANVFHNEEQIAKMYADLDKLVLQRDVNLLKKQHVSKLTEDEAIAESTPKNPAGSETEQVRPDSE